ncbi:MAG: hypothetical protein MN733_39245, partial [Nitrososphaera sp.]|nr:hypothetical protein [Nitrososphaera sp.]
IIGLFYQFGYLMLPSISVPLVWLLVCRKDFGMVTAAFTSLISRRSESGADSIPAEVESGADESGLKSPEIKRRNKKMSRA